MPVATAPSASSSGAVPIPTHMMRGGIMSSTVGRGGYARSTPLATLPAIHLIRYGYFPGLLYYSLHSMLYEDELYPTALHLFEARKFLPYWPDLADRIRQCEHVEQVASISTELAEFIRRDCLWTHGLTRRWTKYCTSSSASTVACGRCFSTPSLSM
jgi:hypothetical protein